MTKPLKFCICAFIILVIASAHDRQGDMVSLWCSKCRAPRLLATVHSKMHAHSHVVQADLVSSPAQLVLLAVQLHPTTTDRLSYLAPLESWSALNKALIPKA